MPPLIDLNNLETNDNFDIIIIEVDQIASDAAINESKLKLNLNMLLSGDSLLPLSFRKTSRKTLLCRVNGNNKGQE